MARTVGIGIQNFEKIIQNNYFYIDKTLFIKEWWENGDDVTLITRPRRFGKTLALSMTEQFFSVNYANRGDLFREMEIWKEEKYQELQRSYPVISLSFANIKEKNFANTYAKICQLIAEIYSQYHYLLDCAFMTEEDKKFFKMVSLDMKEVIASMALYKLSDFLYRYYGKRVIILLDEYDTPMQEAYVGGYWEELTAFTRSLFNSTFKTNPWLERAIMTGITRGGKESVFSDLNNLEIVTTTSDKYETTFGFTESEVFCAMDEFDLSEKQAVKQWYDGFTFGRVGDIYNPWSILNYLDKKKLTTYWANTSSNSLIGKLIREGSKDMKFSFEILLSDGHLCTSIDEQIVYNQLDVSEQAVWSLLLASGYLKVVGYEAYDSGKATEPEYELGLTNLEVKIMFQNMIRAWFAEANSDYNDFLKALLVGDVDAMTEYMNRVALQSFSTFDTGRRVSKHLEPERFYHGFVLGLMVELQGRYRITSNRESGFGRYDIMLEPASHDDSAIIIEFKVFNGRKEKTIEETVRNALQQIEDKKYETELVSRGIDRDRIVKYGFAFEGESVLIGESRLVNVV